MRTGSILGGRDFWGGIALIVLALFAFWASWDLPGMLEFQFGPGTAPRLFAGLLLVLGAAVVLMALLLPDAPLERYHLRGLFFVTISILTFGYTVGPLGLICATFSSFMLAAVGSTEQQWGQTFILGIVITAFCCILFPYFLGLPFHLLPVFLLR